MTRTIRGVLLALVVATFSCTKVCATTHTAASCNESDVQNTLAMATGNGDLVVVPSGTCIWTTALTVTLSNTVTIQGAGIGSTIIQDNVPTSTFLSITVSSASAVFHLTGMTLEPAAGLILTKFNNYPMTVDGTCSSGTCTSIRFDHLSWTGWKYYGYGNRSNSFNSGMMKMQNVFGVMDHLNVMATTPGIFLEVGHSDYLGVGTNGDNSWAQPDTFGSANALYIESSTFNTVPGNFGFALTDTAAFPGSGVRLVVRYNTISSYVVFDHGTDTGQRGRGGRQFEIYNNTYQCTSTNGCLAGSIHSGTALIFNNSFTPSSGGWYGELSDIQSQRGYMVSTPWGWCDGTGPYDLNDGAIAPVTGTLKAASNTTTFTVNGSPGYTTNQFAPGANSYALYDAAYTNAGTPAMWTSSIVSNTSNTIKVATSQTANANDSFSIIGTTLYDSGTITSSTNTNNLNSQVTDSGKSWTVNQWQNRTNPYFLVDVTLGIGFEIVSNTANTITVKNSASYRVNGGTLTWNNGDRYRILRTSACIDQASRGQGDYLSGLPIVQSTGWVHQALAPIYEWGNALNFVYAPFVPFTSDTNNVIQNRNFYIHFGTYGESGSFDGTKGVGQGLLAARPSTCTAGPGGNTPGVGYFATDQGSQGTLYVCNPTNTWKVYYTPYTYPHPLTQANPPSPPMNLKALAH